MLNSIFTKEKQMNNQADNYETFKLINSYDNYFHAYDNNAYDDATVRTCIDVIAKHAAKLKPTHIKQNDKVYKTNSNLDGLLSCRPNEFMNTYDFLYKIVSQLYSYNNAFVYIKFSETGQVLGIYPLNFQDVQLIKSKEDNNLYCKFQFYTGAKITVSYSEIIHLRRHFNKHDFFGESNEVSLKSTLSILNTVKQALVNAVKNSSKLRGYVKYISNLNPKDLLVKTKAFVTNFLSTSSQSGGIAGIDNTAEFHQLTSDIKTADNEQMNFIRQDVYRYFGINENIITSKYNEEEWNSFYESIIEPIAIQLSLEFTSKLFTEREKGFGNKIIFDANRLQYASTKTKTNMIKTLMPIGIMTINECREIFSLSPVEGGDKRQISLNYVNANKQDLYQLGEDDSRGDNKDE